MRRAGDLSQEEEDCSAAGALWVSQGTHSVALEAGETGGSLVFREASLWAR